MNRTYLDWNATAPLRPEARAAMLAAMDLVGNPSSVHAEGRAVKSLVEKSREDIAEAFGAMAADIVFTSGATEAAALALRTRDLQSAMVEHDSVLAWTDGVLSTDAHGQVTVENPADSTLQLANSETGVLQSLPKGLFLSDCVQAFGKIPVAFNWLGVEMAMLSAHKIGGPKGIGALAVRRGLDLNAQIRGGGQESGRRSGTENVIGIAGFAAAARAAMRDLNDGLWQQVAERRRMLEDRIRIDAPLAHIIGTGTDRLPNTSAIMVPGWKGETQVMQMDLAGFAISAGSACSSGKVKSSQVLKAMGLDDIAAASVIRVSIGPDTTKDQLMRFADSWLQHYQRYTQRAA
ncbi:MAG: cysteine desulfurase [Rhodobacteraceae bacterium]|nr:cysteine desulfurase [Paracoccaceae bacterium]